MAGGDIADHHLNRIFNKLYLTSNRFHANQVKTGKKSQDWSVVLQYYENLACIK